MLRTKKPVRSFSAVLTGDEAVELVDTRSKPLRGGGLNAGVTITLGTSMSVDITVVDSRGHVIFTGTSITADGTSNINAQGIIGPLTATSTNNSGGGHTVTATVSVRS